MRWAKDNAVLLISALLAAGSAILVPPDAAYLDYFDVPTLATLFCMLASISALHGVRFFAALAERIVGVFGSLRGVVVGFVLATALASSLFTNDMALLALLPLAALVLSATGHAERLAFVFVMMTIAANLGGMVTPFGSPQNLYLYSRYEIPAGEFAWIMAVPFAASMLLLLALCLAVPRERIAAVPVRTAFEPRPTLLYLVLFALTVCMVLRIAPLWAGALVPLALLVVDRRALARLDWGLMGTFVAFFVFAGNLARVPAVTQAFESLLQGSVLLWSALSSQVISNVPSAILLSRFTENYPELLVGVNIGGVGTLVASLASLITLNEFRRLDRAGTGRFLVIFTVLNVAFFAVLLALTGALFASGLHPGGG